MSQTRISATAPPAADGRAQNLRPAVFFDRDGVLNVDHGYVHKPADFDWIPGAPDLIRALNASGRLVFVFTNQSGVARCMYDEQAVIDLHDWINRDLARIGAHIDAFAYCPHHPEGIRPGYAIACQCRKPAPGLLLDLIARWPVDRAKSVVIGDQARDLAAAAAAGLKAHHFTGGDLLAFARGIGLA